MENGRMIDKKLILFIGVIFWIFYASYKMNSECNDKGGILVRGAFKYECVKSLEKVE
jgi:hypothetical protein